MAEKTNGTCCCESAQYKEIDAFIDELKSVGSLDGKLIAILHKAQEICGYLPQEVQAHVARRLSIPQAKVYGVVTFYHFFSQVPRGKYVIDVCMGTACFVKGADKILDELKSQLGVEAGQTTEDGEFTLNALRCVGVCGLAPIILINGKSYGKVTVDDMSGILDEYRGGGSANG